MWRFLSERKLRLRAVDEQGQGVCAARCNLAGPQGTPRAISLAHHDLYVVVKQTALDEGAQISRDLNGPHAADIARKLIGMCTDVAKSSRRPGNPRVAAPARIVLRGGLGPPVLRILDLHQPNLADFALRDQVARMPPHGIPGVRMRPEIGRAHV